MLPFLVYEYWKWMKVQTILPKECCSLLIFRGHRSPFLFQHGAGNLIGYSGIVPFKLSNCVTHLRFPRWNVSRFFSAGRVYMWINEIIFTPPTDYSARGKVEQITWQNFFLKGCQITSTHKYFNSSCPVNRSSDKFFKLLFPSHL